MENENLNCVYYAVIAAIKPESVWTDITIQYGRINDGSLRSVDFYHNAKPYNIVFKAGENAIENAKEAQAKIPGSKLVKISAKYMFNNSDIVRTIEIEGLNNEQ